MPERQAGAASATPAKATDPVGRILDGIDVLAEWGGWASVACILGILALIVGEVIARNVLNISLAFAWEFSSFLMGAGFMLGAAYSLRSGAQIRVMAVLDNLSPARRRRLDIVATLCAAIAIGYLTCALTQLAWLSFARGSRSEKASELPLWIAQAPLALGAAMLTLQMLARFARLLRGEPGEDVRLRVGQDAEGAAS